MTKLKLLTLFSLLFIGSVSFALSKENKNTDPFSPSSNIAWDAAQLNFVKSGDAKKGETLNKEKMCSLCHGNKGISNGRNWPNLAGQLANYTFKQMRDYKDNNREDSNPSSMMSMLANQLTDKEIADLAIYYSSLPLPEKQGEISLNSQIKEIIPLIKRGDGSRMLPACLSCHGAKAQGTLMDIPALAGQKSVYFKKTMNEFKNTVRHNDIYSRMRIIAKTLTDDEIDALTEYFATVYKYSDLEN